MDFITRPTKIKCIVASVLTALALITLIMLSTLLNLTNGSKALMCLIFSISLMLVLLIWQGIIEIQVFNDYKSQNRHLCADGILNLCMGALIAISAVLFGVLQASKIIEGVIFATSDIRIFLTIFIFILIMWKIFILILSIKEKRFNWWCDLITIISWFTLGLIILISMFNLNNLYLLEWFITINSWVIIALSVFYILFSYVIKTPDYLKTQKAIDIQLEEKIKERFLNRENDSTIEDKLKHAKELKQAKLISDEDYQKIKEVLLREDI